MVESKDSLVVKNLIVGSYTTATLPANAAVGTICFDTTLDKLAIMCSGGWEAITSA